MLVVIDESGDAGFKPASSSHFVIGMIIFDNFNDAEGTANIINKIKREIGFKREFKFSHSDNRKRDVFFNNIRKAKFKIRIFVIEKKLIYSHNLRQNNTLFINYCLKNLMKDGSHRLRDAVVKIDGTGNKVFKKECASYLRKEIPSGIIKDIKFRNSKNDVLIQLADMIVSAYSRPFNNADKQDSFRWRNMFENKIENVWNFK
ncbi:MAG: DUF3800 domain-containing protein [Rickettsiales bacterium]